MFANLLKKFARDESGVFMVVFAVMAIALIATAGAVVDFVSIDQTQNKAQLALDSAALALQPQIYTQTKSQLQAKAQAILTDRIADPKIGAVVNAVDVNTTNGTLFFRAELKIPMAFVALVGIDQMTTQIIAQSTRKKLYVEVALVLDNSGSMAWDSRLTNLKSASKCAINILFYGTCSPGSGAVKNANTKVGLVPFNFFVNVGASHANDLWIDKAGKSVIAKDNFDNDDNSSTPFAGPVDRLALYAGMVGQSWKGCVEARPYPYSVNDTAPTPGNPDTLFVPEFAPDEPDSGSYSNNYITDTPNVCNAVTGSCTCTISSSSGGGKDKDKEDGGSSTTSSCTYTKNDGTVTSGSNVCSCGSYTPGTYTCKVYSSSSGLSDRVRQERLCKYSGASPSYSGSSRGPNAGCPNASIQPLTDNIATLTSKIDAMVADGATNIHMGAAWGFRVLSPGEPFTEGRPYDTATSKVMILMTDGENTYYTSSNMNGTSYYAPYGYLWNGRLGKIGVDNASSMQTKVDGLTVETCNNAKAAGITVYTIGLSPPNQATKDMLTACASSPKNAYFPAASSELNSVFATIAQQLSQLRIEK